VGQIKNTYIKNLTKRLLEEYPEKFTNDFEKNKKELEKLISFESKKIRNLVAGYLVHLTKKKEKLTTIKVSYQAKEEQKKGRRKKRGK
jgi:small subunit ribosomal protein S17e